ncbi:hypothetical protein F2Q70_00041644 [Brassica cretica]|uniref:Ubiquitin-like domain-containing protein n=1 Tax=Brassica cretica TaxID=69181 RepID=A0A8S9K6G6_BRACR|nr:hypothetical protein F2Q70_00041644 [Brassica cretica]
MGLLVTGTQEKMYVSHANTLTWKMSSPSSPSSSSGFSFFLKVLPSGDVMLIEASRRDRVSDIMARIKINKKIPGFEQCALVYGGRQLQSHQLLCDCSIEKNTLVFLIVGPNPWPAVDSLLDTVCRVYQGLGVDNDEISDKLNLFFHNIPWYDDKLAFEYLQLLSVPTALAMLYSSFKEEFAKDSVACLRKSAPRRTSTWPAGMCSHPCQIVSPPAARA